ncbi:MAG: hypothetical protein HDR84_06240 [Bacteroides sp.]|nr:hypothetical protein [Bacteroides sp.]
MKKILLTALALGTLVSASAQTARELVITDKEGKTVTFPAEEVDGIIFQAQPEYMKLKQAFDCSYEETNSLGLYSFSLATNADPYGNPATSEDLVVHLVMAAPWSDDVNNPVLPAGYYKIGRSDAQWTFDVAKSYVSVLADGTPSPSMIVNGTVDVRDEGDGNYDIRLELIMFTGAAIDLQYKGKLDFPKGFGSYQPFTETVDIVYDGGQGRFWGNWFYPFAADLAMTFYKGTIEEGYLKDGYMLDISFYEPKPEDEMDPNQKVADGTYTVETREAINYTYLPFKFEAGERTEFMGTEYLTKTRLVYYGPDGSRKLGLIKGGTFTVSENGTKFVFDFVTEEGVSIKGSYTGTPLLQNYCDNDQKAPSRPYSTLTENVTLDWVNGTYALSYNEGHSILDNANTMMLMITHPSMETGDYISIDLFTESETLPDGTFTVGDGLEVNHIIPGEIDYGGGLLFSWYGDLDEVDADGYNTKLGPISSGTVTISTLADGNRKVVFNVKDDNNHSITGEFSGPVINVNDFESMPVKVARNKKFAKGVKAARRVRK